MNNSALFSVSWIQAVRLGLGCVGAVAALSTSVYGGGAIVVDNDEWTLSDDGFGAEGSANATAYAQNAASFLTGGSGSILIYSDNFGLNQDQLEGALTGGGYSVTEGGAPSSVTPFTLASLSPYKAVFLGGDALPAADSAVLQAYVNGGGGVYIAAGTGTIPGGSAIEAAQWNSFLTPYDLSLASTYNGIEGDIPVVSTSPVLADVSQLYYNNGNTVSITASGNAQVITYDGSEGLIGTYSASAPDATSTLFLTGMTMALLGLGARYGRLSSKAKSAE